MKKMTDFIPYSVAYRFDDELEEVAENAQEMGLAVAWLLEQEKLAKPDDDIFRAQCFSLAGVFLRILKRWTEAELYLNRSIDIYQKLDSPNDLWVSKIRLATLFVGKRQAEKAVPIFETLKHELDSSPSLSACSWFL
jgi:hypothetical protein